jgi:Periplasmic binding protein/Cytochrome c
MKPSVEPLARLIAGLIAIVCMLPANAATGAQTEIELGRRIYQDGVRPDGQPVTALRWNDTEVSGKQASCAQCHRPSGMGAVEGDIQAPPVTGLALFGGGDRVIANMDPRSGKAFNQRHDFYDDDSLARAVRDGQGVTGNTFNNMMPRYQFDAREMHALSEYLRQLSVAWSPGVSADMIRFATVITPEVDQRRRNLFKDMMAKAVQQKNGSTAVASKRGGRRHMAGAAEFVLGTERKWTLDFWELSGPPESWAAQLDTLYRKQPVFALVSGLSTQTWDPVSEFCEQHGIPDWFPSVDVPPANLSRYSMYFSKGVALEAEVFATYLRGLGAAAPARVVQIHRDDDAGRRAARALTTALASSGIDVHERVVSASDASAFAAALDGVTRSDALMFWIRPPDVRALEQVTAPSASIYFSAHMSDAENTPLAPAWKRSSRLIYPYELPDRRQANLAYFKAWLKTRRIALIDESMQSEVYFALAFLTDTVTEMLDNLYRDYLIERAENMISRRESGKVEAEVLASTRALQHRLTPVPSEEDTMMVDAEPTALQQAGMASGRREGTTVYPRLGLGPGQRFASKGAYIVRFAGANGEQLVAESNWIVP